MIKGMEFTADGASLTLDDGTVITDMDDIKAALLTSGHMVVESEGSSGVLLAGAAGPIEGAPDWFNEAIQGDRGEA